VTWTWLCAVLPLTVMLDCCTASVFHVSRTLAVAAGDNGDPLLAACPRWPRTCGSKIARGAARHVGDPANLGPSVIRRSRVWTQGKGLLPARCSNVAGRRPFVPS
jgi:hypothetical protein